MIVSAHWVTKFIPMKKQPLKEQVDETTTGND